MDALLAGCAGVGDIAACAGAGVAQCVAEVAAHHGHAGDGVGGRAEPVLDGVA